MPEYPRLVYFVDEETIKDNFFDDLRRAHALPKTLPYVGMGIIQSEECETGYGNQVRINRLELVNFTRFDGKSLRKTGWGSKIYKAPRKKDKYRYAQELLDSLITVDAEFGKTLCAKYGKFDMRDKEAVWKAYKEGFLEAVEEPLPDLPVIKWEGNEKDSLEFYFTSPPWQMKKINRIMLEKEWVYDDYESAHNACYAYIAELQQRVLNQFEIDFILGIEETLNFVPDEWKETIRFILQTLPREYGSRIRFYDGKLLYQTRCNHDWFEIFDTNKEDSNDS